MTNYFVSAFIGAFCLNTALTVRSSDAWKRYFAKPDVLALAEKEDPDALQHKQAWKSLIVRYLVVYLLATAADWLQGAYIYVLYHAYGYSQYDIAVLFIAGFGSSAVFGSFIGGMADAKGRRLFVVVYGAAYALSCVTKRKCGASRSYAVFATVVNERYPHMLILFFASADFRNFFILLIGRVLGGIATSLLFSIFEAWLIRAHADSNLKSWISKSFTWAAYGNSIIAIISGLIANHATGTSTMHPVQPNTIFHMGGYLAPFDMALLVSVVCGVTALHFWEENYGEQEQSSSLDTSKRSFPQRRAGALRTALTVTLRSRELLLLGLVSSLYEGAMYVSIHASKPSAPRLLM